MNPLYLPRSSPYDPAEDPPGSVDPLGTAVGAEQLADVLLPGLTARMWRARLLTFAALAAIVARRVAAGSEERWLDARLAFERLFVSALARQESGDRAWRTATRRLPGVGLARAALRADDQPLGPASFLKGQAANGPYGVISRLARDVGVVDEAGDLGRGGIELLTTWAAEQGVPDLMVEDGIGDGEKWLRSLVRKVEAHVGGPPVWPAPGWAEWETLAARLRPDGAARRERQVLRRLLAGDSLGLRDRVIAGLESTAVFAVYQAEYADGSRGGLEQAVLVDGLRAAATSSDEIDGAIRVTIDLIDAYESVTGLLETAFRGLLWGLTRRGGMAARQDVLAEPQLRGALSKARSGLGTNTDRLRTALSAFEADPLAGRRGTVDVDRMRGLVEEAATAATSTDACVTATLDRHRRVQAEKGKGVWVEEDRRWTLMPGFGDTGEAPPEFGEYLHPFRVTNTYSLLADLSPRFRVRAGGANADPE
jgi:hypothetical protein